jgi:hypothetical protein
MKVQNLLCLGTFVYDFQDIYPMEKYLTIQAILHDQVNRIFHYFRDCDETRNIL